jgi:hypothetical protein
MKFLKNKFTTNILACIFCLLSMTVYGKPIGNIIYFSDSFTATTNNTKTWAHYLSIKYGKQARPVSR